MWPLIKDFFTTKDAGVRGLRYMLVVLGEIAVHLQATGGEMPTGIAPWILLLAVALPAALTKQPKPE